MALRCGGKELDFATLHRRSSQLANAMVTSGVGRSSRVAFLGRTTVEFFEVLFAVAKVQAVAVPINWRLAVPEILDVLKDARPQIVIVDADHEHVLRELADELPWVEQFVSLSGEPPYVSYEAWLSAEPFADPAGAGDPSQICLQLYTSGTTGKPKGVMMQSQGLVSYLHTLSQVLRLDTDSVSLSTLPLFHIGGIGWTLAGLYAGCETVLLREADPEAMIFAVAEHRVTTVIAVPVVLQRILAWPGLPDADCTSLRLLYYGGGPITQPVLDKALSLLDCDLVQGYGLTECPLVTVLSSEDHGLSTEALRSCGRPVAGTEIRIADSLTGEEVAAGEVGELWVRSPQTMVGYWCQPEATAAALVEDGWLRTGDAARVGAHGLVYMADRIKDMIVSGGENVYSAEVENALTSHPDVMACAVIGVPSATWTETVKAVVVLAPGSQLTAAELTAFCRRRLAAYKCPTSVDFVSELPLTPSGKVMKHQLRAQFTDAGA